MRTTLTRRLAVLTLTCMASVISMSTFASEDEAATPSLYERLGGMEGIGQIVDGTIALHHKNPDIAHFFEGIDDEQLAHHVTTFFAAGTGGPATYAGRDMTTQILRIHFDELGTRNGRADPCLEARRNLLSIASFHTVDRAVDRNRSANSRAARRDLVLDSLTRGSCCEIDERSAASPIDSWVELVGGPPSRCEAILLVDLEISGRTSRGAREKTHKNEKLNTSIGRHETSWVLVS